MGEKGRGGLERVPEGLRSGDVKLEGKWNRDVGKLMCCSVEISS